MTEHIDFSFPEDVLIQVKLSSKPLDGGFNIIGATIISDNPVMGAASYEQAYSGFLVYALKDMLNEPILVEGFHVITGVAADITKSDGWTTDDDIDWYYASVRPATDDEIALF